MAVVGHPRMLNHASERPTRRLSQTHWLSDSNRRHASRFRHGLRTCLYVLSIAASFVLTTPSRARIPSRANATALQLNSHVESAGQETRLLRAYRHASGGFEANLGQTDPRVRFVSRHGSYILFLTANQAVLELDERASSTATPSTKRSLLTMTWMNASLCSRIEGIGESRSKSSYLIGADRQRWLSDVPSYSKVQYQDFYRGVDLIYYEEKGELEYDLVLSPGAHAGDIALKIGATADVRLDSSGDLIMKVARQQVVLHRPVAYQPSLDGREPVRVGYILKSSNVIGFKLGAYDQSRPLIIDPRLIYSSYLGGSASDDGAKVTVDANGNAYLVGWSASIDFPTVRPLQPANAGATNVVISKFNVKLHGAASLVYSTYLGGSGRSAGRGIAVDALGQVFISGDTNAPNFPTTSGAYQTSCKAHAGACSTDVFAAELNSSGNALLYSTYVGGSGTEYGFAMAIDSQGHIFVGGNTDSPDFPVTKHAFQTTYRGGPKAFGDAFVLELNPVGHGTSDLRYASYLGGSGSEAIWGIATDQFGAVYVAGSTSSPNFPVTSGAYQSSFAGGSSNIGDGFITKLTPSGRGANDLAYSTYLGGSADDRAEGIALDSANLVYVTGYTQSSDFPVTTATAFQPRFGGGTCFDAPCADAFIAKLNPAVSGQSALVYSTFFGGSSIDLGHGIALDSAGLVYITGETTSTELPLLNPIQDHCASGCRPLPLTDVLVAKFDLTKRGAASLLFSTYLGGNNVDTGWSIAVDRKGNAYITGQVFSTDFPIWNPYQAECNNCSSFTSSKRSGDAFLVEVCTTNCPPVSFRERLSMMAINLGRTLRRMLRRFVSKLRRVFRSAFSKWRRHAQVLNPTTTSTRKWSRAIVRTNSHSKFTGRSRSLSRKSFCGAWARAACQTGMTTFESRYCLERQNRSEYDI